MEFKFCGPCVNANHWPRVGWELDVKWGDPACKSQMRWAPGLTVSGKTDWIS